jgi:Tol biopolymer transport system component
MARFRREAQVLASLNHPNIGAIYGVEEGALVMELVEGPTLADRINQGRVPLDEALGIARQIADALEAAHEKGVVHRDLKPANVKITSEGVVKVLDFGLAKAAEEPASHGDPAASPTLAVSATDVGEILGTAAYMAPEQARGKTADKRADIWAFGVVLYEMLTGGRLFQSQTIPDTLAAVLKNEPDWDRVPAQARRLVRACLERDPRRRLRDIGDMQRLLEARPEAETSRRASPKWQAATAALAVSLLIVIWGWWRSTHPTDPAPQPLVRLDVDLGPDVLLESQSGSSVIISADGARLAYVSHGRLYTRRLDESRANELAGTDGAYAPFFSPDGQWIAFFTAEKLKKISVEGGGAVVLCNAPNGRGGSWGEEGDIVAALNNGGGLSKIPADGGAPVPVTEPTLGQDTHRWPQVLPGGKAVLFTSGTGTNGFDSASIEALSFKDQHRITLIREGTYARYLPASKGIGHLLYTNHGRLFAVSFDPARLEVRGSGAPLLQGVAYSAADGSAQIDFSRNGMLLYRSGGNRGFLPATTIQWLDGTGKAQPLLAKQGIYTFLRLSPDGRRLAMTVAEGANADIQVYDWQRDRMTRLTFGGTNQAPLWTPDSRYIAFNGAGGMFYTRADGAIKPQPLTISRNQQFPASFTADGKQLLFQENNPASGTDLWTTPIQTDSEGLRAGKPEMYLQTPFNERQPFFSPDGRWLAYTSNESGVYQVYARAFPDKGGKLQISNAGGMYPFWSHNGRELFFRTLDNQIMVAGYTVTGDSLIVDKPRLWGSGKRLADLGFNMNYNLSSDGKRIVALMPAEVPEDRKAQNQVTLLLNFTDEMRRRFKAQTK